MANTNPPDKIDDRKAPAHWLINAPQANAHPDEVANTVKQHHHQNERQGKPQIPAARGLTRQHDSADMIRDGGEGVAGRQYRSPTVPDLNLAMWLGGLRDVLRLF